MWPNPQFPGDLVTFTGKILNGKLHFFFTVIMGRSWLHFITNFGLNEVLTNHDLNPQMTPSYRNSQLIYIANQWVGLYMMENIGR